MTTVSLYIPCYNGEPYIEACIEGVLSQTLQPDEILVIDDGSTDRSAKLARAYQQVRVIRHKTNKGLSVARNTAIREARCELIAALDVDCVAKPTWLETLVAIMDASPKITGCAGMLVENFRDTAADRFRTRYLPQHWGDEHLVNPPFLMGANTIFRKTTLQTVGGYDERFHTNGEDADICRRLAENKGILVYEPSAVAFHLRKDTVRSVLNMQWQHVRNPYCVHNPPDTIRKMLRMMYRQASYAATQRIMSDIRYKQYNVVFISFLYLLYAPWRELGAWWLLRQNRTAEVDLSSDCNQLTPT